MNKAQWLGGTLLLTLSATLLHADGKTPSPLKDAFFLWKGTEPLPAETALPPAIAPSDLGEQNDLTFSGEQFFFAPLPQHTFEKLTLAFFLKPENRSKTEHIISTRSSAKHDGFVVYNMHTNWGFAAGDGITYKVQHLNDRRGSLVIGEWQHLAVTFDRGEVTYYRNGQLVTRHQLPIGVIRLMGSARLRIGGGGYAKNRTIAPYTGKLAGIVALPRCLPPEDIPRLMAETNP